MPSYNLSTALLIWGIYFLASRIGLWVLFSKAGLKPWYALIPIWSTWQWTNLVGRKVLFFICLFIPIVNVVFWYMLLADTLKAFNRHTFVNLSFYYVLPPLYNIWIVLQRKQLVYLGKSATAEWKAANSANKNSLRDWLETILVILTFIYHVKGHNVIQTLEVGNSGMENTIKNGDYVLINRFSTGLRFSITPIWLPYFKSGNSPIYTSAVEFPYMRLPGFDKLEREDLVAYNLPFFAEEDLNAPIDRKPMGVGRIYGLPGETIEIKHDSFLVNQKPIKSSNRIIQAYVFVGKTDFQLSEKWLQQYGITEVSGMGLTAEDVKLAKGQGPFVIFTNNETYLRIQKDAKIKSIELFKKASQSQNFIDKEYANTARIYWDNRNFGPIIIPKRGMRINLTLHTLKIYEFIITQIEKANITTDGKNFFYNGRQVSNYQFKYNYYFVMNDNRDNLENNNDSRTFGLVPETNMEGRVVCSLFGWKKSMVIESGIPLRAEDNSLQFKNGGFDRSRLLHWVN